MRKMTSWKSLVQGLGKQVARRCFVIPLGTLVVLASDRTGHTVANPAECIPGKIIRWVEDWKVDSRGASNDESYCKVESVPGTIIRVPTKDVHVRTLAEKERKDAVVRLFLFHLCLQRLSSNTSVCNGRNSKEIISPSSFTPTGAHAPLALSSPVSCVEKTNG